MTIVMVTHDVKESFHLGTRLLVFDKPRATRRCRIASAQRLLSTFLKEGAVNRLAGSGTEMRS